jgi:hypothetical protein
VQVVLRGDSTLRGHVFAETDVFVTDEPILFLPAFPAGGRVTVDGTHYVEVDGRRVSAEQTEYAQDPVFGFGRGDLVGYVREQGNRDAVTVPLAAVRETRGRAVADALLAASAGVVVAPDAETDADVDWCTPGCGTPGNAVVGWWCAAPRRSPHAARGGQPRPPGAAGGRTAGRCWWCVARTPAEPPPNWLTSSARTAPARWSSTPTPRWPTTPRRAAPWSTKRRSCSQAAASP